MNETATLPEVEVKAVRNATISIDKAEGIVEAFAAAVGNKDSVGDVITPGAFNTSLKRRKPRVVWGHNWNEPIGKVLEITEVPPSDPRLPSKMKEAGVGGLFVKVQFNLNSERGREAFASVMFFGEDQEWSIGYKTITSDYDPLRSAKLLKEVELYEVSPVLHGANNLTGTISVKDATQLTEPTTTGVTGSASTSEVTFSYVPSESTDFFGTSIDLKKYFDGHTYPEGDDVPSEDESDERRMIRKAFISAFGEAENMRFVDNDKVVFDKPGGGMWMSKYRRNGRQIMVTRPVRARSQMIYVPVEVEPSPNVMRTDVPVPNIPGRHECSCGDPAHRRFKEDEEGPEEKRDYSKEKRNELAQAGNAMADGSYPIATVQDLKNAIQAIGRAKNPKAVKKHIASRARALNVPELIPDSWKGLATPFKDGEPEDIETKVGRVISTMNMGKLRQAAELLNSVVNSGMPPEKPSMEEEAEEKKTLNGKVAHLRMSEPAVEAFSTDVAVPAAEYSWTVKADDSQVDVYFSTDDNMDQQVKTLAGVIDNLDESVDISVEKMEFYGTGVKTFSEVFEAK